MKQHNFATPFKGQIVANHDPLASRAAGEYERMAIHNIVLGLNWTF
jgi:hypothetical protein